ncbi:GNAT family N-acetyltransferase [Streptomyces caelestis]|uniref:GNAT family N-acetyltransferase n=1 Tax=Streptomyces caelestis TaxID=36816 RepID=UPI0036659631
MPSEHEEVQVRPGAEGDLTALTDLYNHYARETAITFDTAPFTPEERRPWLLSHPVDGPYRLMVATDAGARGVLGYATSSPFRPKPAYATSVETTVYVAPGVAQPNDASARLHERFGFRHVGTYREVGRKFGRWWDVAWYEKEL